MNIHSIVNISKVSVCFILVYVVSSNEGLPPKSTGKDTSENIGLWKIKQVQKPMASRFHLLRDKLVGLHSELL